MVMLEAAASAGPRRPVDTRKRIPRDPAKLPSPDIRPPPARSDDVIHLTLPPEIGPRDKFVSSPLI